MSRVAKLLCVTLCGCISAELTSVTDKEGLEARLAWLEAQAARVSQLEAHLAQFKSDGQDKSSPGTGTRALMGVDELNTCLDHMWLLICGALVMFMQAGFAIIEAGSVRAKNSGTVLLKNVLDVCLGTVAWYFVGYGLAYGVSDTAKNDFIGTANFAGSDFLTISDGSIIGTNHLRDWFFQWAFCATAATIVSGAVAGRIQLVAYLVYSVVMTAVIYPAIVYWTWNAEGWLVQKGYSDFAGSGIVHLTGGVSALVGAIMVGPRKDRWNSADKHRFDPHNLGMVVLGTLILWFGWYGFNCGSTLAFSSATAAYTAALCAMNTTLSASTSGLTVFFFRLAVDRKYDLPGTCNGILVGLVAICAGCNVYGPSVAFFVGIIAAFAQEAGSRLLKRLKVDDPLDAFAVHGCGGIVGVLVRPIFDINGADEEMFGYHCLAIVCIAAWAGGLTGITLGAFRAAGKLRVSDEEQEAGTDAHELGIKMYRASSNEEMEKKSPQESAVTSAEVAV